jgi:membrane protein
LTRDTFSRIKSARTQEIISMVVQRVIKFGKQLYQAFSQWLDDEGSLMAAAVSFYAALSFFPLLLILLSVFGYTLRSTGWGQDARGRLLEVIQDQTSANLAEQVGQILDDVGTKASTGGPIGLATLLFTAMLIFANFQSAFDRIWNVEDPKTKSVWGMIKQVLYHRLRAFLMLLAAGALVLVGVAAAIALGTISNTVSDRVPGIALFWRAVELIVPVLINFLAFTLIYRILPKMRVRWSEAMRGALVACVAWEIGRQILSAFLIGDKYSAYGVVGAFIAILLWVYYVNSLLFIGAEYVQVICQSCPRPTSGTVPPQE